MVALATLVGCFTAAVPVTLLAAAVATLDYRVSGTQRNAALRRAVLGLVLSVGWGVSLAALIAASQWWLHQTPGLLPPLPVLVLTAVPVVFGVLPSGVLWILAWGPSSGTPDQRPTWRVWVDSW